MPMILGRLRVVGRENTVIFDGQGEVIVSMDPLQGLGQTVVLEIRDGNYQAQMDLTGVAAEGASWSYDWDVPGMDWDENRDPLRVPDPPSLRQATLHLDIPPLMAEHLRRELYRGHPDHQPVRRVVEGYALAPRAEMSFLDHLRDTPEYSRICAELYEQGVMREESVREAFDQMRTDSDQFAAREELIRSTRAQFPHDPYDYGRVYPGDTGSSRWTPPEDPDERIPSCPA